MEPSRTSRRRSISVLDWVATFLRKKSVFPDIRSIIMDMGSADCQPLQKQLKELKDGRANYEATIMMLRTQVAALQATAVQEGNAAQETIESLQAQVAALEHDKTAAEEQTSRANAKMTPAAAARKEMKAVLQRREAELQKAEKKLHDTMRNSNKTQRKFEKLEAELNRKTRELEKAGALTERVAAYARDLESERESLEEQLEESRKAIPVIEEADCKFLRQLGEGATATVDLFSVELAVKRPKTKEEAERLEEEGSTMASLHHPGLPAPVCWIEPADGSPRGLAMPLIRGGTLHSRIWGPDGRPKRLQTHEQLDVMEQMAAALVYVHEQGYIHADVKPENILVDGGLGHIILNDLGHAYSSSEEDHVWRGTRGFFLPAGVFDATKCGPADDLRGLLGVGYEMAAAKQGLPCELYMRYKAHADAHPEDEVKVVSACIDANLDPNSSQQAIVAEYLGFCSITEADFEDLMRDPSAPHDYLRLLIHGLSSAAARGEAEMPSLAEIRAVIQKEREKLAEKDLEGILMTLQIAA